MDDGRKFGELLGGKHLTCTPALLKSHHGDFLICTKLLVFCNFMSNSWTTKMKWLIFFNGKLATTAFSKPQR
jgi:hypothetical protein